MTAVDPLIRFDQATFDAVYGSASFELADYYRIEFSENLPGPEPTPVPLLHPSAQAVLILSLLMTSSIVAMRVTA